MTIPFLVGTVLILIALLALFLLRAHTLQRKSQQALAEKERYSRTIIETAGDAFIGMGVDGRITDWNRQAEVTFGWSREEVIGRLLADLIIPAALRESHRVGLQRYLATGEGPVLNKRIEISALHRDGHEFPVELAVWPIRSDGGVRFNAFIHDITERKTVEKMKNEFISLVSHELRTPLTSIRGSLGLIVGGVAGALSDQAKTLLTIAVNNCERLVGLINDILDIEKIESGKMELRMQALEVMPLVEQAIEMNRAFGEQLKVSFVVGESLPGAQMNIDRDKFLQVLTNLLSNGAKYSPARDFVTIALERRDDFLRVSVSDHGPGIPKEFQYRVFEKFAQADSSDTRKKGGTGLGLSITKALVERMGGTIGFETGEKGTTFFFELPEWHEAAAGITPSSDKSQILICEDDHDVSNLLRLILKEGGFEADIAYSAAAARRLLGQKRYDGMTLDLILPDEDGVAFLKELRNRERTVDLPIVVVSIRAHSTQERMQLEGNAVNVVDWIDKPVDEKRLLGALHRALRKRRGMNGAPRILHVEDDRDTLNWVSIAVKEFAQHCPASTFREAEQRLKNEEFDLVLLDLVLPDGNGENLLPLLGTHHKAVPVVIFSSREADGDLSKKVSTALVKSRSSGQELVEAIKSLLNV